jgi:hypothetical protein
LVRQWHEDFPALHSEGGLPGSESAGIVAFIRERLVDLEEKPLVDEDESTAQNTSELNPMRETLVTPAVLEMGGVTSQEHDRGPAGKASTRSRQSGYLLDAGYSLG